MTALSISDRRRQIKLRPDSYVSLRWGLYALEMRMVDLLVLRRELDDFSAETGWQQTVLLQLNGLALNFTVPEIEAFHALVRNAAARLPRQTIRWADLDLTIRYHAPIDHNGLTHFSNN